MAPASGGLTCIGRNEKPDGNERVDAAMTFAGDLLAPMALLFTGISAAVPSAQADLSPAQGASPSTALYVPAVSESPFRYEILESSTFRTLFDWVTGSARDQVRIEQRMTIRIAPSAAPLPVTALVEMSDPDPETPRRFVERKMGKCVPVSGIAAVQPADDKRLILFMRDRRLVSAALERSCHARDYYSGFYLARSGDGQLCVDRDTLQSRNGANCKLDKLRQLLEVGE